MTRNRHEYTNDSMGFHAQNGTSFHQQVEAGIRRAPQERALALKTLWDTISNKLR